MRHAGAIHHLVGDEPLARLNVDVAVVTSRGGTEPVLAVHNSTIVQGEERIPVDNGDDRGAKPIKANDIPVVEVSERMSKLDDDTRRCGLEGRE